MISKSRPNAGGFFVLDPRSNSCCFPLKHKFFSMKTDNYTKALLTVIAACLVVLTIHNVGLLPTAYANEATTTPVPAAPSVAVPLNDDGSISVRLVPSETISIDITDISTADKLKVNLEEVGGSYIYNAFPVEIEE